LTVDLANTKLQTVPFERVEHQLDGGRSWWVCWREADAFNAACGAMDLPTVVDIFLTWSDQGPPPQSA
jgi:hypothetical protein